MSHYVYVLYSVKLNRYYVGQTHDIENRLSQHNSGRNVSTKGGIPWDLKYTEIFNTRFEAMQRESQTLKRSRYKREAVGSPAGLRDIFSTKIIKKSWFLSQY